MPFININKSVRHVEWSMNDLHSHSHYEIYYLYKGKRTFILSDALYRVEAPVIIVIPPYVMHKTEGGPFERYNIDVSPDYLDQFQQGVLSEKELKIFIPTAEQNITLRSLFRDSETVSQSQKDSEYRTKTLFSYFILLLEKINEGQSNSATEFDVRVSPLVLKVIDYFNVNYSKQITLDDLEKYFFVSKATLLYNFKKYTNCSPIDFLINLRITKAKQLLASTDKTINEISMLCGFSSPNYFGLLFKQKEKLSPGAYRKYKKENYK